MPFLQHRTTLFLGAIAAVLLALLYPVFFPTEPLIPTASRTPPDETHPLPPDSFAQSPICNSLSLTLPSLVHPPSSVSFNLSVNSYWSLNARELLPACVVRPSNADEVAAAVRILKAGFDAAEGDPVSTPLLRFAVRSGGHSPEAGFASVEAGVLVDLSQINRVEVSADRRSVRVGVGARWGQVSAELDGLGLAMVGGRNSEVGVGGLVLGGGVSFFSPRYGMVCDNVDGYEIVLANGTVAHVTSTEHGDLWRALKGGGGNFGIVTRVTAKTLVAGQIWAGYAYWAGWQTSKVLKAFAEFNKPENFDEYAAGPILALSYVQKLGIRITVSSLVYTKPEKWPRVFDGFRSIWRLWSTHRVQSLSDATSELAGMAPAGQRQFQVTTTVINDIDTLEGLNEIYTNKLQEVTGVKGSVWSLVLQPLSAAVTRKGNPNVLGLESRQAGQTLIIVLVSVSWLDAKDDKLVQRVSREIISLCKELARRKGTADPYHYLNYAASGQDPINGYGEANKEFLRAISKLYDPDEFFQRAKHGGLKLF